MPELSEQTVLSRSPDVMIGDLPDETVLLHVADGSAVKVNTTGAWLWALLEEPQDIGALAARLAERHALEAGRALQDVRAFASDLVGRGYLHED